MSAYKDQDVMPGNGGTTTNDFTGEAKVHPTEAKFPIQTAAFRDLIQTMYTLHLNKNKDYSPANITVAGEIGVVVRIWDKFCRICNLSGLTFPAVGPLLQNLRNEIKNTPQKDVDIDWLIAEIDRITKATEFNFSNIQEKEAVNEPLDDAWLDLAVYAIIGYLKRKGKWGR